MMKKTAYTGIFSLLILFLCASITPPKTTAILFDLNGVLFRLSKMKSAGHLGIGMTLSYIMKGGNMDELKKKYFDILHQLDPDHPTDDLMPLHEEAVLPKVMRDWLAGRVDTQDVITRLHQRIDYLAAETAFFATKVEVRLMKKIVTLAFDPETRAEIYKPIKEGIELVRACKKRGHEVYLISNMDSAIIPRLKELYPEIFELFDGTIISADINTIKPYPDIYVYTLIAYNLDANSCYLVDDQHENIRGAEHVGIQGFLCDYRNYNEVVQAMIKEGILRKADLRKRLSAKNEQGSRDE